MSLDIYLERERYITYDKITLEREDEQIYWKNITHNLTEMADKAGIYEALWRPFKLLPNYNSDNELIDKEYEYIFEENNTVRAKDITEVMQKGLKFMKDNKDMLLEYNPDNGWGSYDGLLDAVTEYTEALINNPEAIITVSR
jgi:hypothetical protein